MTTLKEILIGEGDLINCRPDLTTAQAKDVIVNSKQAMINGQPAKVRQRADGKPTPTSLAVEVPSDLGGGPWTIFLLAEDGGMLAAFEFDPEVRQIRGMREQEEKEKKQKKEQ
jgi:hypothetical protein